MASRWERLEAKGHAYEEAAGHLGLDWSDDPLLIEEGNKIAAKFSETSNKYFEMADRAKERELQKALATR